MVKGELKSLRITLEAVEMGILGYVYLKEIAPGEVAKTVSVETSVRADYDREGHLIGVEFLNARLADMHFMRALAGKLNCPELNGIDLAEMCKTAA